MQILAVNFIRLQEARHSEDYDLSFEIEWDDALDFVNLAIEAKKAWERIENTAEGNIFVLSLLLWKQWEKER